MLKARACFLWSFAFVQLSMLEPAKWLRPLVCFVLCLSGSREAIEWLTRAGDCWMWSPATKKLQRHLQNFLPQFRFDKLVTFFVSASFWFGKFCFRKVCFANLWFCSNLLFSLLTWTKQPNKIDRCSPRPKRPCVSILAAKLTKLIKLLGQWIPNPLKRIKKTVTNL